MVTFDVESGVQVDEGPRFSCPRCRAVHQVEVIPGERKFTDYAYPPTYMNASPTAAWDPTGTHRSPLPMPYQLPGYNPYLPY